MEVGIEAILDQLSSGSEPSPAGSLDRNFIEDAVDALTSHDGSQPDQSAIAAAIDALSECSDGPTDDGIDLPTGDGRTNDGPASMDHNTAQETAIVAWIPGIFVPSGVVAPQSLHAASTVELLAWASRCTPDAELDEETLRLCEQITNPDDNMMKDEKIAAMMSDTTVYKYKQARSMTTACSWQYEKRMWTNVVDQTVAYVSPADEPKQRLHCYIEAGLYDGVELQLVSAQEGEPSKADGGRIALFNTGQLRLGEDRPTWQTLRLHLSVAPILIRLSGLAR